jgi:protein transport protein SEC23
LLFRNLIHDSHLIGIFVIIFQIQELLGVQHLQYNKLAMPRSAEAQRFLLPVSECEFNITSAIEDLCSMSACPRGHRPLRATGAAISTAIALLEGCCPHSSGGRIMVFTSGPATVGPGLVVETDLGKAILIVTFSKAMHLLLTKHVNSTRKLQTG